MTLEDRNLTTIDKGHQRVTQVIVAPYFVVLPYMCSVSTAAGDNRNENILISSQQYVLVIVTPYLVVL